MPASVMWFAVVFMVPLVLMVAATLYVEYLIFQVHKQREEAKSLEPQHPRIRRDVAEKGDYDV